MKRIAPDMKLSICFILLVWMCIPILSFAQNQSDAEIQLSARDLENTTFKLDGPWEFYPFHLLQSKPLTIPTSIVQLPHLWNLESEATGFASYRSLIILTHRTNATQLSLHMPDVYSAYTLLINGRFAARNGVVGTSREQTRPHWLPQLINFTPTSDTTEIIIHVSNFHHSKLGIGKPITISSSTFMTSADNKSHSMELILVITLSILAITALVFYASIQNKQLVLIFYSLLCISWALRAAFSNDYLAVRWFNNLDWNWVVRVEYLTLYSSTLFGLFFVQEFYPRDFNKRFRPFYIVNSSLFTLTTLFTAPIFFTRFVNVYLAFSALLVVSIIFVLIRAFIQDRKGIAFMSACILIVSCLFGYLILSYENLVPFSSLYFNFGFLMIFILLSLALWFRVKPSLTTEAVNLKSNSK